MFRVVIVGGSIAGLGLALMLEKNGIDFVVLEAYPEIAPQVGASIAILPNGFRILDQLGCYDDLVERAQGTVDYFVIRDSDGKRLIQLTDVHAHLVERLGYPMTFFERRMLIEILYKHIRAKDKVLTSKRVTRIEESDDGVTVTTTDGGVFKGDILIGADGMHSAVRKQICQEVKPEDLPATYQCLFGISGAVPGIVPRSLEHTTGEGSSLFAASGPDNRTYWCLFINMGKTHYGEDAPRYDEKTEKETVAAHGNDPVNEEVKFSDLYERRIMSVSTPLHEYVLEDWHTKRCMISGDAVHKVHPIFGLGGMSALETAAALTNKLVKLLKANDHDKISSDLLESLFREVQDIRKPRAKEMCDASQKTQWLFAMESPLLKALNRYIYPTMGTTKFLQRLTSAYLGAVSLDMLSPQSRPRATLYADELLRKPQFRSGFLTAFVVTILAGLSALGTYLLHVTSSVNNTWSLVHEAVDTGVLSGLDVPLRSVFGAARFPAVDNLFKSLIAVFLPVVSGAVSIASKLQVSYFLVAVYFPLLSVIVVEGYRKKNTWTLIWSPSLWTVLAQLLGLGVVLPLYVLASFLNSQGILEWMPADRPLPRTASKAILPSVLLGYLIPSILLVALDANSTFIQETIVFWQITPVLVILLTEAFSQRLGGSKHINPLLEPYLNLDLPHLRRTYDITFVISASAHVATLATLVLSPTTSFLETFIPRDPQRSVTTVAEGMFTFFQFDLLVTLAATLVWSIFTIWDLHRVGLSDKPVFKTVFLVLAGYVVVGPGATTAALWKWRENTIAKMQRKIGVVGEKSPNGKESL